MRRVGGFTLVELAIVLVVIGLLVGMGAGLVGILVKRAKVHETKETLKAARESLISYAGDRGCFDSDAPHHVRKSVDAWGQGLMFIFANEVFDNSSSGGLPGTCTDITDICDRGSTGLRVNDRDRIQKNIAFVVISGGLNYNIQTYDSTLNCTSPNAPEDPVVCSCNNDTCTISIPEHGKEVDDPYSSSFDPDRDESYDDPVEWVSLYELKGDMDCPTLSVSISSPSYLPYAEEDSFYRYQLSAAGGRNNKWGIMSGSTCDITNSTIPFPIGLFLDRNSGEISGMVDKNTYGDPGELNSCEQTQSLDGLCVCADLNDDNTCNQEEPYDSANFTLPVRAKPVEIITDTLPDALEGTFYNATIKAIGGNGSYSFSVSEGSLPTNLILNSTTGQISGTPPTDTGCSENLTNFLVTVESCSSPMSYTKGFSIRVKDPDCYTDGGGGGGSGGGGCTRYLVYETFEKF